MLWLFLSLQLCFTAPDSAQQPGWFRDVTRDLGVDFIHQDGRWGQRYFVETAGSGGGFVDFDNDGDLDIYLVNAAATPGANLKTTPRNQLYRNDNGRFVPVGQKLGVADAGYGVGFCVGDVDGDGLLDFFITNFGVNRLLRNRGDGGFEDITERAGVAGNAWGTNAAFGDIDGDGDLDLYVSNYVVYSYENNPKCGSPIDNISSYCNPDVFKGQNDFLFLNDGSGRFTEVSRARGIVQNHDVKSYGALLHDIDEDGDLDIFVASDGTMNRFYLNDGKGFFVDESLLSGVGYNADGDAEAGMGMDIGDVDGDGLDDLYMTHYAFETNTLYINEGDGMFEDKSDVSGLGRPGFRYVGWGVRLFDMDNDGDLDAAVANGHVIDNIAKIEAGATYAQPNQLFRNDGKGRFTEVTHLAGSAFARKAVSRGLAVGDWDNDGRLDLLITNTNDRPDLLHNQIQTQNNWIGFRIIGPKHNKAAIGAVVTLKSGRTTQKRVVRSGGSYLSQSDLRAHFGLGDSAGPVSLSVRFPDGSTKTQSFQKLNTYHDVTHKDAP